jgi:hypothetical protein
LPLRIEFAMIFVCSVIVYVQLSNKNLRCCGTVEMPGMCGTCVYSRKTSGGPGAAECPGSRSAVDN